MKPHRIKTNSGQIIVEYVLLLMVGVLIATLITSTLVSRSEDDTGFLILKWKSIIQTIGEDTID
jgi:uncharacterized protein (UPF0333 family)